MNIVGTPDMLVTMLALCPITTLAGKREPKSDEPNLSWQRRERAYGTFSRVVQLPFRVDPDKVQARFDNGILEIELERLEGRRLGQLHREQLHA